MKHFYELAMRYKLFFILLRGWRIYFMVFNYILYRGYIFWWGLVPFIEKTFVKVACYLRNNDLEKLEVLMVAVLVAVEPLVVVNVTLHKW